MMKRAFRRVFLIIVVVLFTGLYILPTSVLAMDKASKEKKQNSYTGPKDPWGNYGHLEFAARYLLSEIVGPLDEIREEIRVLGLLEEGLDGFEPPLPGLDELEKSLPIEVL